MSRAANSPPRRYAAVYNQSPAIGLTAQMYCAGSKGQKWWMATYDGSIRCTARPS